MRASLLIVIVAQELSNPHWRIGPLSCFDVFDLPLAIFAHGSASHSSFFLNSAATDLEALFEPDFLPVLFVRHFRRGRKAGSPASRRSEGDAARARAYGRVPSAGAARDPLPRDVLALRPELPLPQSTRELAATRCWRHPLVAFRRRRRLAITGNADEAMHDSQRPMGHEDASKPKSQRRSLLTSISQVREPVLRRRLAPPPDQVLCCPAWSPSRPSR